MTTTAHPILDCHPGERLSLPEQAMLVIAGVPGAGKTTLIRQAVDRSHVRVIDTDDRRAHAAATGERPPRLLYLDHYRRIAAALSQPGPVVVHTRGTHRVLRLLLLALARHAHRPAHLLLLHADRHEAERGQQARGRVIDEGQMQRQVERWEGVLDRASEHGRLPGERWSSVCVLTRTEAAALQEIRFDS